MGRSLSFRLEDVPLFNDPIVHPNVLEKIAELKIGDQFIFRYLLEYFEISDNGEKYVPLRRCPSIYEYQPMPIIEGIQYIVDDIDNEHGLEILKGFRSIQFSMANTMEGYLNAFRLCTDGTIREWESLGIVGFVVQIILVGK